MEMKSRRGFLKVALGAVATGILGVKANAKEKINPINPIISKLDGFNGLADLNLDKPKWFFESLSTLADRSKAKMIEQEVIKLIGPKKLHVDYYIQDTSVKKNYLEFLLGHFKKLRNNPAQIKKYFYTREILEYKINELETAIKNIDAYPDSIQMRILIGNETNPKSIHFDTSGIFLVN